MAEEPKGQTIMVEVAPNVASADEVVQLGAEVGKTAQSWLALLPERNLRD
jgi:HAMP domain-containing protein